MAKIVATSAGATEDMIAAAWLHDVLEDTPVSLVTLRDNFSRDICEMVFELTDTFTSSRFGNRKRRKKLEADRLALVAPRSQTIKYADLISNTSSIIDYDPDFAKIYLEEKAYLLEVMTSGDKVLREIALNQLEARHDL